MRSVAEDMLWLRGILPRSASESIMLAVKAKYENGAVRWEQKPPVTGFHDLIVVFRDVPASDQ